MTEIQEQYDELLTERGLAAQEESHYRNMSWSNRAKHAAKLAAVSQRYNELEAQIEAFAIAHPEVLSGRIAELKAAGERAFND